MILLVIFVVMIVVSVMFSVSLLALSPFVVDIVIIYLLVRWLIKKHKQKKTKGLNKPD